MVSRGRVIVITIARAFIHIRFEFDPSFASTYQSLAIFRSFSMFSHLKHSYLSCSVYCQSYNLLHEHGCVSVIGFEGISC